MNGHLEAAWVPTGVDPCVAGRSSRGFPERSFHDEGVVDCLVSSRDEGGGS